MSPHHKARIFIGSSREGKKYATGLQSNLGHDHEVTIWDQDVFELNKSTLENLVEMLEGFDFGVFVFSPDDALKLRGEQSSAVRDNVLFELGLFMGRLGRECSFFVRPQACPELHIPSDLLGITGATFDHERSDKNWTAAMCPASEKIRAEIYKIWITQGYESSRHLPTGFAKPQTARQWLRRVMQSGFFCGIDDRFWLEFCERMLTDDSTLGASRARELAETRNTRKISISVENTYGLMRVLLQLVLKRADRYFAIATEMDLQRAAEDTDSETFIFDDPARYPDSIWRLFLVPDLQMLRRLRPEMKQDLITQMERKVNLKVLKKTPGSQDNFGVYGNFAVGTLDPETGSNLVDFNREAVNQRRAEFLFLWDKAKPLTQEMLG